MRLDGETDGRFDIEVLAVWVPGYHAALYEAAARAEAALLGMLLGTLDLSNEHLPVVRDREDYKAVIAASNDILTSHVTAGVLRECSAGMAGTLGTEVEHPPPRLGRQAPLGQEIDLVAAELADRYPAAALPMPLDDAKLADHLNLALADMAKANESIMAITPCTAKHRLAGVERAAAAIARRPRWRGREASRAPAHGKSLGR